MELVDPGQRVDADDAEELFETRGKMERSNGHLLYQLIDPLEPRIVDMVQSHEDEQEALLNGTEGFVEDQQIVALCQHLLLPSGAKAHMRSYHVPAQFVWIYHRFLLPPCMD